MSNVVRFIATALAFGLTACALVAATPPSADVMDVRLVGIGLTEQRLAVTLCVTNPNPSELAFQRVTAGLDVSGAPLAAGVSDLSVRLPPLSSTILPFTVVTTVQNIGPQLLGIVRSGSVSYRVHGTVALQGTLGITLPFSRSGRLNPLAGGLDLASAASGRTPSPCATSTAATPAT